MKLLAGALAIMAVATAFAGETLKLASGGKALFRIAVSEQQNQYDKFAVEDLQSYLGRMSGAEFGIVKESELAEGEAAIFVGHTARSASLKLDTANFDREEWCIRMPDANSLVITGGSPIGAFYGTWAVLNHLGCYAITWNQDAIPSKPELNYDGFEEQRKPAFASRMIYDHQPGTIRGIGAKAEMLDTYYRWILRNYVNGKQDSNPRPYYINGVFNISHSPQYHSMEMYVPAEKYFKDHPEYYWMLEDGKRRPPQRSGFFGGLCLSNPDVLRIALEKLRSMIKHDRETLPKDEWPYVYDFSRMDASPYFCKCPECVKIAEEEGSQMGLFYRFLNKMAAPIKEEYPDVVIRTFGEWPTSDKPDRTIPLDNILIWVADNFTRSDCFRPMEHPINTAQLELLKSLYKDGSKFMIWDYWNLGNAYFTPPRVETNFDSIQPDIRYFRSIGATDIFIESSLDSAAPQNFMPLCYFVAYQLMVDTERDVEALADVFIDNYYGPNADLMRRWFKEIRAGVSRDPKRQVSSGATHWEFCTPEFMLRSYKALKAAAEALPKGDKYRRRIEWERTALIWSVLNEKYSYERHFKEGGVEFEALYDECRELARDFIGRYGYSEAGMKRNYAGFEERFKGVALQMPIPEKFKDVPAENLRVIGYPLFKSKAAYGASIVNDPDSVGGKVLCGSGKSDDYNGVDKIIEDSGKYKFRTTYFEASGASLRLREVPQDEQYHWFKMEGKTLIRPTGGSFWGQGWAIHADLDKFYVLTNGDDADNTWDETWFRAKFTGPAYVPGSTKKNAIYIDVVVLKRDKGLQD